MKFIQHLILLSVAFVGTLPAKADLRFSGASQTPVEIRPDASSGLSKVYVLFSTSGVTMTYTASSAANASGVEIATYDLRGAAYSEPLDPSLISRSGADVTITTIHPDCGYIFTEGDRTTYYWVADYSTKPFTVSAINPSAEQDCDRAFLTPDGSAPRMVYYSINGRSQEIDRQITLSYQTLTADEENMRFESTATSVNLTHIDGTINVAPPLCNTYFTLSSDRFLRAWGLGQEIQSPLFTSRTVTVITSAEQQSRQNDNELKVESTLGGSAPVDIHFSAAASDAAVFSQWLMATDEEMEDVVYRTQESEFDYTFTTMGTYYLRYEAADASGQCETFSDLYTVYIGESYLRCPNAFSPSGSECVNDIWKVTYKSIISFECYIFNRWGEKMAEFHDPAQGWDGKRGGKVVPAGVYYYVIKAKGSDGRKYNLSGDINILNYNN